MIRVTDLCPAYASEPLLKPGQSPTTNPTRTVPLPIPSLYPPIWLCLCRLVSVLPWFCKIASIASIVVGLEHSTPLKVKYQRLQQRLQKATLRSPSNSTFKAVSWFFLTKTQSYKNKERHYERERKRTTVIKFLHKLKITKNTNPYQSVILAILQWFPGALFPVPLRDHPRETLFSFVALGSFRAHLSRWSDGSLASFGPFRALRSPFTGGSHKSLVTLGPVSSTEPRHSGDTWDATDWTAWDLRRLSLCPVIKQDCNYM